MKRFTALYKSIDASTSTAKKVAAMVAYFREAPWLTQLGRRTS